jgi:hypothetical protein
MKLNDNAIGALRVALHIAKAIDLELAVLENGQILGINDKKDAVIISELKILPEGVRLGIGRVAELQKRLTLFGDAVEADLKVNDKQEGVMLTLQSGRSKVQFRCTSMGFLDRKYPKENADEPLVVITFSKAEASQLVRASKSLSAETILVKVSKAGEIYLECSDSTNDQFSLTLDQAGDFVGDPGSTIFSYRAGLLTNLLEAGIRDNETVDLVMGAEGSMTIAIDAHTLIALPKAQGE